MNGVHVGTGSRAGLLELSSNLARISSLSLSRFALRLKMRKSGNPFNILLGTLLSTELLVDCMEPSDSWGSGALLVSSLLVSNPSSTGRVRRLAMFLFGWGGADEGSIDGQSR